MPKRIQMSRQHPWRADHPEAVKVDRTTPYGNPFRVGAKLHWRIDGEPTAFTVRDRGHAVDLFHSWLLRRTVSDFVGIGSPPDITALRGLDLACWCPLDEPCHADVLLRIANITRNTAQADGSKT